MPLLAVTYVKGRPGATTTALGLAACAPPGVSAVLVECDPAGGDLMRRHRLPPVPTLVDLAATARGTTGSESAFAAGIQSVVLRTAMVPVVVAPPGGAQTRAALPELTAASNSAMKPADRVVVADCGRLTAGSPVWPLLRQADVVVVMARSRVDELAHLRERLGELVDGCTGRLVVLLAPGGMYAAADVAEVLSRHLADDLARDPESVGVLGPLPADRRAAAVLGGELLAGRRWRRLPLMRAYTDVWHDLAPHVPPTPQHDGTGTGVSR